ncbi:MAG: hypothetical protein ACXVLQ_13235 [Bacteriovorax sp.]
MSLERLVQKTCIIIVLLNVNIAYSNIQIATKTSDTEIKEIITATTLAPYDKKDLQRLINLTGPKFTPYTNYRHIKSKNGKIDYDVNYTIGAFGLRKINENYLNQNATRSFILAGDSNTFGEGCLDPDTLEAKISPMLKDYYVYNFGVRGGGPHNTLAFMENFPYQKLIKQKKGIFIYNFLPSIMFDRIAGAKNYIMWDKGKSPYYDLDEEGKLIRKGNFNDRHLTNIFRFIGSNSLLNFLLPTLPRIGKGHVDLLVEIFAHMKANYLKNFPENDFIVIVNENYGNYKGDIINYLLERLEKKKILFKRIPWTYNLKPKGMFLDGHFNGLGQQYQATQITNFINFELANKKKQKKI